MGAHGTSRMIFTAVLLLASFFLAATSPQPANKSSTSWACPEYGLDFDGSDITHYDNIANWQNCARLCHMSKTCSHWSWDYPRSTVTPNRCYLKSGDSGATYSGNTISGEESCNCCNDGGYCSPQL